jgi:hypothetical protein
VTDILIDGLIAVITITDRALSAVERNVRHRLTPRAVDVQPAGAGTPPSAAGTGGHPFQFTPDASIDRLFARNDPVDDAERLLLQAAAYLNQCSQILTDAQFLKVFYQVPGLPPLAEVTVGLRDLAAQFAADAAGAAEVGD